MSAFPHEISTGNSHLCDFKNDVVSSDRKSGPYSLPFALRSGSKKRPDPSGRADREASKGLQPEELVIPGHEELRFPGRSGLEMRNVIRIDVGRIGPGSWLWNDLGLEIDDLEKRGNGFPVFRELLI